MDLSSIALSMRTRMPWPVGQIILSENDIPRSRGWDQTVERLTRDRTYAKKADALAEALKHHTLCGEKSARFYKLSNAEISDLRKSLVRFQIPPSAFQKAYPTLLSEAKLAGKPTEPTLIAVVPTDDGVAAVFSSVRVVTIRETLDPEDLADGLVDALSGYDEIIGLKSKRLQAVDVVWVPHQGNYVDIRIDYPRGMHHDVSEAAHERVKMALHAILGKTVLRQPVNLFPLIKKIYNAPTEGTVVELGFGTTTASLKNEKMRRKSLCLRNEHYHVGGKAALKAPIEPFRLSVIWPIPLGSGKFSKPELSLNSSSRMVGATSPMMTSAIIRGCIGLPDFEHVRSRIEHYL